MKQAIFTESTLRITYACTNSAQIYQIIQKFSSYLEYFRGGSYIEDGNIISKFTFNNIRECAPVRYILLYLQFGVHVQVSILSTRDTIFPIQECLIRNCSDKWEIRNCLHGKISVYRCQQYIIFLYNAILKNNRINFEISLRNLWVVTFFIGNQSFVKEMLTF